MAIRGPVPGSLAKVHQRRGQTGLLFDAVPVIAPVPLQAQHESEDEDVDAAPVAVVAAQRKLWSVAELVSLVRGKLEREFADVWVAGELSNCRSAPSGHVYFTLKDGDGSAQLSGVLFRREATLLRFRVEDGLAVVMRGRMSVFEGRGQLQIIAETMEPRGAGALAVAFEQLKTKLAEEGLFAAERKRALPPFPRTIGVVTSLQGAVLRDIFTVCRRRHGCLNLLVYPITVQGPTCANEAIAALRYFNRSARHRVDIVLLARGGGSQEDLQGFNDEGLARAIAASDLPVVSAIGHETDFTIADFVADLRAPTPSAAAEMITAHQHRVEERVAALEARLLRGVRFQAMRARQRMDRIAPERAFARMRERIGRRQQRVDERTFRLEALLRSTLERRSRALVALTMRLQQQDLRTVLLQHKAKSVRLHDRLLRCGDALTREREARVSRAQNKLHALSPLRVLDRGYALVFAEDGSLLRSAGDAAVGSEMTARLAAGSVRARITETMPAKPIRR